MASYSVATAKNELPGLIHRAQAGEHIIITRRGTPVAEIRAVSEVAVNETAEERKARLSWNEWMRKRRDAGPTSPISSVELLNQMYDETPW